jgi:hypothetical protein
VGQLDPFFFAHRYDGKDPLWRTGYRTLVATDRIDGYFGIELFGHGVGRRKDLPHRYLALRKKDHLDGDAQMDRQKKLIVIALL